MNVQQFDVIFSSGRAERPVSVIVPLYNYAHFITEALNSVARQTYKDLAVIVVDDCSTDSSLVVAKKWMELASPSDHSLFLLSNVANAGLSIARNTGIFFSKSEYCFFLDADNMLYPACVERHVSALSARADAAGAFSLIETFGSEVGLIGANVFDRKSLTYGNYIDAMAMLRKQILEDLDGFYPIKHGWEDYDLWLRLLDKEQLMIQIPEILSRYRIHEMSMLRTETNILDNLKEVHRTMSRRHDWLQLKPIASQ